MTPVGTDGRVGAIEGVMLSPQRPQNLEFVGSAEAHRGHGKVLEGCSPALTRVNERPPHLPQNRTPSANREPHCEQATIPGMMLEPVPLLALPSDGDGWLVPACAERNCACMTCSDAPSRISITRSSSLSPARATRRTCCPGGISAITTRPELPMLAFRSSLT